MTRLHIKRYVPTLIALVLGCYLILGITLTSGMAASDVCTGVDIIVADTAAHPFVTGRQLNRDLGDISSTAPGSPIGSIDTYALEKRLLSIDKVEEASVLVTTDRRIRINVVPMKPVARVFDGDRSYYINKDGKRMTATSRYHIDVPVIIGRLDRMHLPADSLLPLIDFIAADPTWDSFVSAVKVDSPRDIMLIPSIHGHVVNLGAPEGYEEKFARLHRFYTKVLPHTGWSRYDTISVKWRGQVVASRANKGGTVIPDIDEDIDETDDATTMLPTDNALASRDSVKHI